MGLQNFASDTENERLPGLGITELHQSSWKSEFAFQKTQRKVSEGDTT